MTKTGQRGATLLELLVVLAVFAVALAVAAVASLNTISREEMRGSAYDVYAYLQLARVEAITRNVECRFVIDTGSRAMAVIDTKGTPLTTDDEVVHRATLDNTVSVARPDTGSAVTLEWISGTRYQTVFAQDGTVAVGAGAVHLFGGQEYRRISALGAGGVEVARWTGTGWKIGS